MEWEIKYGKRNSHFTHLVRKHILNSKRHNVSINESNTSDPVTQEKWRASAKPGKGLLRLNPTTTSYLKMWGIRDVGERSMAGGRDSVCCGWSMVQVDLNTQRTPSGPSLSYTASHPRPTGGGQGKGAQNSLWQAGVNQLRPCICESQWLILKKRGLTWWHLCFRNKTVIKSYSPNDSKLIHFVLYKTQVSSIISTF